MSVGTATMLNRSASVGHASSTLQPSTSTSASASTQQRTGAEVTTLNFAPRGAARQPLYRPAALRRTDTSTSDMLLLCTPTPPVSPKPASRDLRGLAAALGLSLASTESKETVDPSEVKGVAVDKDKWQADADASTCSDEDCSVRFGVIDRRHHCRRCGMVFCSSHSSRSAFLWASAEQSYASPRPTPRGTPRSSVLDIPSLQTVQQSYFTVLPHTRSTSQSRSSSGASTPIAHSPPISSIGTYPAVISARVCDSCYFTPAPSPPLLTPPLSSGVRGWSARSPSRSRSPGAGPGITIQEQSRRSRQGSSSTASSSSTSQHFLSLAAKEHRQERRRKGQRAQSPASFASSSESSSRFNSLVRTSPPSSLPAEVTGPISDDDDDEDDIEFVPRKQKQPEASRVDNGTPGVVVGSLGWGGWATF